MTSNQRRKRDWKERKFEKGNWERRSNYYRSHLANDEVDNKVKERFNRSVYGMSKKVEEEKKDE